MFLVHVRAKNKDDHDYYFLSFFLGGGISFCVSWTEIVHQIWRTTKGFNLTAKF